MKSPIILLLVVALAACSDDSDGKGQPSQSLDPGAKAGSAGETAAGAGGSADAGRGGDAAGGTSAGGGQAPSGQGGMPPAGAAGSAGVAGAGAGGGPLTCEQLPVLVGSCQTCKPLSGSYVGAQSTCVLDGTVGCVDNLNWAGGESTTILVRRGPDGAVEACLFLPGLLSTKLPDWEDDKEGDYDLCDKWRKSKPHCQ